MSECCFPRNPEPSPPSDAPTGSEEVHAAAGALHDLVSIPVGAFAMGTDDPHSYKGDVIADLLEYNGGKPLTCLA